MCNRQVGHAKITQSTPSCNDNRNAHLSSDRNPFKHAQKAPDRSICSLPPLHLNSPSLEEGQKTVGRGWPFVCQDNHHVRSPLDRPNQSCFPESCHDTSVSVCVRDALPVLYLKNCPVDMASCFGIAYIRHMGGRFFTCTRSKCHSRYCPANKRTEYTPRDTLLKRRRDRYHAGREGRP